MSASEAHTPLEMLLLFQTLDPADPDPPSFIKLSESLKNNALLRKSTSYNSSRLDPDSLQRLYLRLMKEEVRIDMIDKAKNDKDGQHNPPLKKLSSPLLDSVNEVCRHLNLLPPLLDRLYSRYRNHAIKAIEDDEYNFRRLQRDIQEINRGEWDARLQLEEINSKSDPKGGVTSIHTLLCHDSDAEKPRVGDAQDLSNDAQLQHDAVPIQSSQKPAVPQELLAEPAGTSVEVHNENPEREKQLAQETVCLQPPPPPPPPPAVPPEGPPTSEVLTHSRTPSTTEPQQLSVSQDLKARPQASLPETNIPILPPRHVPTSGFPLPPTESQRLHYPQPQPQPVGAPSPNPRPPQVSPTTQERPSQSPITLPPLAGVLRSPLGPLNTLTDIANQQQFKPNPALPSSRPVQLPLNQSHAVQLPPPRNYPVTVYPYYDSQQQAYGAPYSYNHNHMTPYHHGTQAGISPYQASAPSPGRVPIYGAPYQPPTTPSYSQYSSYSQPSPYQQTPVQPQVIRSQVPRFSDQRTPISGASGKHRPPRPSPINTSTTSTRWKNVDIAGSVSTPGSPTRPRPEEISPLSEKAPSPFPETLPSQNKQSKSQSNKKARGNSSRGRTSRGRGPRAASTASSTAAGSAQPRTRSQSLLSHADELCIENNPTQHHKIKPEPAVTPAGDEDASITETTADEGSRKSIRRRRETLRGLEMTETSRACTKRKRGSLEAPARASSPSASAFNDSRPNHVFGSRNFPRTSGTIMNDISGHKLASMFAKPITDREAPGYKDLIFRPQDLKSIKSAIVAGSKALVSAADSAGVFSASGDIGSPVAQPGGGTPNPKSAGVWIPATADLVPPKGIVNSAQLEKELMRMFANAVMFNPDPKRGFGPAFRKRGGNDNGEDEDKDREEDKGGNEVEEDDGVVKDTREMYEAVERSVAYWRAAERAVEDLGMGGVGVSSAVAPSKGAHLARLRGGENEEDGEADELAGEDRQGRDEDDGGGAKRRRR